MSPNQRAVLDAIRTLSRRGVPPTYREIAAHVGTKSIGGTHDIIHSLIESGHLAYDGTGKRRSLVVVDRSFRSLVEKVASLPKDKALIIKAAAERRLAA